MTTNENWEKDFDRFYPTEFANDGEKQLWEERHDWFDIKSFIRSLISQRDEEIRKYVGDWANVMWDLDVFDHDDWSGVDEVEASIMSYLEGKHLPKEGQREAIFRQGSYIHNHCFSEDGTCYGAYGGGIDGKCVLRCHGKGYVLSSVCYHRLPKEPQDKEPEIKHTHNKFGGTIDCKGCHPNKEPQKETCPDCKSVCCGVSRRPAFGDERTERWECTLCGRSFVGEHTAKSFFPSCRSTEKKGPQE